MTSTSDEVEKVRQLHALAKELARSETPVVQSMGVQVLAISKLLVTEIVPEEFEHLEPWQPSAVNG